MKDQIAPVSSDQDSIRFQPPEILSQYFLRGSRYLPPQLTDPDGPVAERTQNLNTPFALQEDVGRELCTPYRCSPFTIRLPFWKACDRHCLIPTAIALELERLLSLYRFPL